MLNLRGKWVLITGASRGIGRLAALEMAKQGCHLILHSRERQHCDALLAKVQEMGVQAYAVQAELSDLEAVEKMLSEIDNKGTQVDVILNNAGLQIAYRTEYLKTPFSDYDISFKVNTIAPMMLVTTPIGSSRGFRSVRATRSASIRNTAPENSEAGSRRL